MKWCDKAIQPQENDIRKYVFNSFQFKLIGEKCNPMRCEAVRCKCKQLFKYGTWKQLTSVFSQQLFSTTKISKNHTHSTELAVTNKLFHFIATSSRYSINKWASVCCARNMSEDHINTHTHTSMCDTAVAVWIICRIFMNEWPFAFRKSDAIDMVLFLFRFIYKLYMDKNIQ